MSSSRRVAPQQRHGDGGAAASELGDFTATARVLPISALAVGIGALSGFTALALLRLIT